MKEYIGVDIGGTKCAVCRGRGTEIFEKIKFPTTNVTETIDNILDAVKKLKNENVVSVGISCGGPLNSKTGMVLSPPNLPGWDEIPIVKLVSDAAGVPAYLCNDANACALAEWKYGAGVGTQNMVFLTFGTGLGAGLILDGKLYSGTSDMAGELGHMRLEKDGPIGYGKAGSFEGFCSGGGIAQLGREAARKLIAKGIYPSFCPSDDEIDKITAERIANCAKAGDEHAIEVYKQSGRMLGYGLSIVVDILNPEVICIGSIYERSGELLEDEMRKIMEEEALGYALDVCKVVPAKLGNMIGDVAALALAEIMGG